MKDGKIPDDFFKDKIDYCGLEDNIYNQLSKTMARAVDIDFAKTPIIDILTGYTRYREAEKKIEQLENIRKEIKKEIKKYAYTDTFGDTVVLAKYIEDILNKGDNK